MYLPDLIYKQKPTIFFAIGLFSGMMVERSTLLTMAQLLLLVATAAIIQLRQDRVVIKSGRVR